MACLAVFVSLLSFGISIDHFKDSPAWIAIEGVCTIVFLAELAVKINLDTDGYKGFFFKNRRDRAWNWIDTAVTTISCCDLLVSVTIGSRDHMFGKFSLLIRALRMIRMLHELSVLRRPWLKDLTHMLIGFLTGCPALVWVFILIWLVVGILAMGLRLVIKVDDTEIDLVSRCVNHDRSFKTDEEQCLGFMYKVVGQQYCGTVGECMFTVFRCLMGECSAYNGTSLVTVLSEHYGLRFNIVYAASMVLVMLGIFNVVTAVFVEATERGILEDDTHYKVKHTYLAHYVEEKLVELCRILYDEHWHGHWITIDTSEDISPQPLHISDDGKKLEIRGCNQKHLGFQINDGDYIVQVNETTKVERMKHMLENGKYLDILVKGKDPPSEKFENAQWNMKEFKRIFQNQRVVAILDKLDIESDDASRHNLFAAFDVDRDGNVAIGELLETLVEMQGRVTMAHITAPLLTLRQVVKRLNNIESNIASQKRRSPRLKEESSSMADTSGPPRPAPPEVVDDRVAPTAQVAANHGHLTATESKKKHTADPKRRRKRPDVTLAASEDACTLPRLAP